MNVRFLLIGLVSAAAVASVARGAIVVRNGPAVTVFDDDLYVPGAQPVGETVASDVLERSGTFPYETGGDPSIALGTVTLRVRTSVVREASGTLAFLYQSLGSVVDPPSFRFLEYDFIRAGGFAGETVEYDVLGTAGGREVPAAVRWEGDVISTQTGVDDAFADFFVRTTATAFDASGTLSIDTRLPGANGPASVTGTAFAPVYDVAAVPLPAAAWPAAATLVAGLATRRWWR